MRIDIKSESELETERPQPGAAGAGNGTGLADLSGMTPDALQALRAAGLESPHAIVTAGRERLGSLLETPGQADEVFVAAEAWVARRASSPASAGEIAPSAGTEGT